MIFERFCYNNVYTPCTDFLNCTPCHLVLPDPNCDRIQYFDQHCFDTTDLENMKKTSKLHIKTEFEMEICIKEKKDCQKEFDNCLQPLLHCIQNCSDNLRQETLTKYSKAEGKNISMVISITQIFREDSSSSELSRK